MNYDDMPAGREMDALVAEKVMGEKVKWEVLELPLGMGKCLLYCDGESYENQSVPRYSEYIQDAWEVVEKMCKEYGPNGDHHDFDMDVNSQRTLVVIDEMQDWRVQAEAPTAPLAICRAALKSAGEEGK